MPFIYFFFNLIAISSNFSTMLNRSFKSWHPYLILNFRVKSFSFLLLYMLLAVPCHKWNLLCCSNLLLFLVCWECFSQKDVEFRQIIFLHLLGYSFLFFILLMCYITVIVFHIVKHACILGIKLTWSLYMIFLMCFWTQIANILLRTLAAIFVRGIGL